MRGQNKTTDTFLTRRKGAINKEKFMISTKTKDKIDKTLFVMAAIVCAISVIAIFVFLIVKSAPAFNKIGFFDFLLGDKWAPDREATYSNLSGKYGVLTMIAGTLAATAGAILIGGVSGYFTAVFLAFFCPKKLKKALSSVINLLAGIPSVVYGFFGIVFLLPILATVAPNNGSGLLATSIILGIMILPTVVSLSKTSLEAVPRSFYEGSVAMGATHSQTVFRVMSPAAKSGITASLVLGVGRALGETMAVVMVAGNSVAYPDGLFGSFRVMTANIVLEMGYAGELQEGALIATGVILLVFVLLINLLFNAVSGNVVKKITAKKAKTDKTQQENIATSDKESKIAKKDRLNKLNQTIKDRLGAIGYKINAPKIGKILSVTAGALASITLLTVIGFIMVKGLPFLVKNPYLLVGKYEFGSSKITVFPAIVTTLLAVLLSVAVAVPTGVMTAIFLNEYTKKRSFLVRAVRASIDVLSGVPSIVYGLFGMLTFVPLFGGKSCILAGVCTISMMLLPTVVRSTEESLKSVPDSLREGSLALGAGKLRTILKVVLPSALPGILSAVILTMGRVVSESAPFLYTMGSVINATPTKLTDGGATLAVALYKLSGEGWYMEQAYATAVILIVVVLLLNFAAEVIGSKLSKKLKGGTHEN